MTDEEIAEAIKQLKFERQLRKVGKAFIIKRGVTMRDMLEKLKRL